MYNNTNTTKLKPNILQQVFIFTLFFALVLATHGGRAQGKVYYSNNSDIISANLDGSSPSVISSPGSDPKIYVNASAGHIYYTNGGLMRRVNTNGTGDISTGIAGGGTDYAFDFAEGKVYYISEFTVLRRANLDGTGIEDLSTTAGAPGGVAIDVVNQRVFWTSGLTLHRMNFDGTGYMALNTTVGTVYGDVEVDPSNNFLYVIQGDEILRKNFDPGAPAFFATNLAADPFQHLALDLKNLQIYASVDNDNIYRFNFSGGLLGDFSVNNTQGLSVGVPAEINVQQGATNIASGGFYGFPNTAIGSSSAKITFTVENLGGELLITDETVTVTGANPSDFVVNTNPGGVVDLGATTIFEITFTPTGAGTRTADISIASNDSDESPYEISLSGTGLTPEINARVGGFNIANGGSFNAMGIIDIGNDNPVIFAIENLGNANLNLTGTPRVQISGTHAADFALTAVPSTPVSAAGTSNFTIAFTPSGVGTRTATLTIPNNDIDEAPYTFTISGTGSAPEINLKQGATNVPDGDLFDYGAVGVGQNNAVTFTIENTGNANLVLSGTPIVNISGANPSDFIVTAMPSSPVSGGSTTTFVLQCTPGGTGERSAEISIENNDADEATYNFTVTATGVVPEIDVKQNTFVISNGGDFSPGMGSVDVGSGSNTLTFTIENVGGGDLTLDGVPMVQISGTNAADFTVTANPTSPISSGSTTTFDLTFDPSGVGNRTATVTIANNDSGNNPFTFNVSGTGVTPEISILQGATNVPLNGNVNLGSSTIGVTTTALTFTILNSGTSNLDLGSLQITGTNAADFSFTPIGNTTLIPTASTTFTLEATPSGGGQRTAIITIPNNDLDEAPFVFNVEATGLAPEFDFSQTTSIASGDSYDFGNVNIGSNSGPISFTISNLGTATLTLTGTPDLVQISGADASDFTVEQPILPTIGAGGSATFNITYTPSGVGVSNAAITISNDDSDEGSFTIDLKGAGVDPSPEINVRQNTTDIVSGAGSFNFGSVNVGSSSSPTTFTIENTGINDLNLSGTPRVQISGTHSTDFVVNTEPNATVTGGGTSTFGITFTPTGTGARVATVTIINDDSDENPYTFTLTGSGIQTEINVSQGATALAVNSNFDFGNTPVTGGSIPVTFTIESAGTTSLILTGTPSVAISGANAADFVVTAQPPNTTLGIGVTTNFTVTFDPSGEGSRSAVLTILNNDVDEGTYTINLTGTGQAPVIALAGQGNAITNGATTPTTTNGTDFGNINASTSSTNTYTIENAGSENLVLSGSPIIALSGASAGDFSVTFSPPSGNTLTPGQSVSFDITYNAPATPGVSGATVTIGNNSLNAVPFTFDIQATSSVTVNAPTGLVANANGLTVQLSWTDNANNEDEFIIERSTDGTTFTELDRVTQNETTFEDATVTSNTTYFYRVVASSTFNTGTSAAVSITIGDVLLPPVILTTSATSDEVRINWQDVNTSETGYAIYRAPVLSGGVAGTFELVFKTQPNETSYVDIGLTPSTNYYYRLLAVALNSANNSALTANVLVQTQGEIPVTPSNLNALALSQTEIQIDWIDNSTNESGYQIFRSLSGNPGTFVLIATTLPDAETYVDQGLTSKTTYYYQIRANAASGASPFTNPVSETTLSNAPESPTDLVALPISGTEVQLNWVDNATNEGGFIVSRAVDQFGTFTVIDTLGANVTVYADQGLTENTNYFYFVQAFNSDGPSESRTNIAGARTANVPLVPRSVRITVNSATSVTISWVIDNAPSTVREPQGFRIEAANILGERPAGGRISNFANGKKTHRTTEDGDLIFFELGTTTANVTSFIANGLIPNQKYTFRVRAFNDNGNSPYSTETVSVTSVDPSKPVPFPPSNLIAESVSQSEIDISWQDNSDNELVFKIERRRDDETNWTEIGQVIGGTTSFSSTNLVADRSYSYRVRASNEGGDSQYTNIDSTRSECNLLVLINNVSGTGNTICAGKEALLEVKTNVTEATFQWKRNGINIPNANLPVYNADRTGEYDCQIISGECRKSSSTPLIVIVEPNFGVTITLDGETNKLEASVKGAQAYQWFRDYQPISGAVESTYLPSLGGEYFVVVTNEGCSATSNLITVTQNVTSVEETILSKSMRLSPNPTESESLLEINNDVYGKYQIIITDMQGRVQMVLDGVKQQKVLRKTLPVQSLAQGVYLVKVQLKDQEGVQKLVKE